MLRIATAIALLSCGLAMTSCGSSDSDTTVGATSSKGLLFTVGDYQIAHKLFRMDPDSFAVEKLSDVESTDTALFNSGNAVLLFNRTADSQNLRVLTPENNTVTIGVQNKFAENSIAVGDPHDALYLGNDTVLLAQWTKGVLTLIRQSTGEKISDVAPDWDLPPGVTFRPESFWRTIVGQHTYIYVVHQGGSYDSGPLTANGSQSLFVLEQIGQTVVPVDLDRNTAKVQGIKLQGTFPIMVRPQEVGRKLLLVSMCSRLVNTSAPIPCKNAVEEFDPTTQSVSLLWDMDGLGFYMNGTVLATESGHSFFAQVVLKEGDSYTQHIVKFNADTKSSEKVYDYAPNSGGYYGFYYDAVRGNLFIGDVNSATVGKCVIIKADKSQTVVNLEAVPYSGVFVY